ncbi:MAG: hypothetical protein HUU35_14020, partial [Armatimonadetes bacterium]|nr:hypothetical protein [Armatimonadota bacterium]
ALLGERPVTFLGEVPAPFAAAGVGRAVANWEAWQAARAEAPLAAS